MGMVSVAVMGTVVAVMGTVLVAVMGTVLAAAMGAVAATAIGTVPAAATASALDQNATTNFYQISLELAGRGYIQAGMKLFRISKTI